jgi:GxxExxY protein
MDYKEYPESRLTEKIIGYCFEVYNSIGSGLSEKVYQNAIILKLKQNDISYETENYCEVVFEKVVVGKFRLDLLVEDKVVVELKVRDRVYPKDTAQLLTYMRIKSVKVGLVILFTHKGVVVKRFVQ